MTYNEFIQNIITTRGQWNIPDGELYENHHIIPRCKGGEPISYKHDTKHENLIWLTLKEHYLAHKLLAVENPDDPNLQLAFSMMCFCNGDNKYILTEEDYELARKAISGDNNPAKDLEVKNKIKSKALERDYSAYKGWHHTDEWKRLMSEKMTGRKITWSDKISENAKNNPNYGMKGKSASEETKLKIKDKKLEYFSIEENREHISSIVKEQWSDPEFRKARSESMRGKKHKISYKICECCGKEISASNYKRHVEKCIREVK